MLWYKLNDYWWVDMAQVREFGISLDKKKIILVYKDGHDAPYTVVNAEKVLADLADFMNFGRWED